MTIAPEEGDLSAADDKKTVLLQFIGKGKNANAFVCSGLGQGRVTQP